MDLTKRQEKQLNKVFDNPKKLRKWVDEVYSEMINRCEQETMGIINEYLDIYSIAVAYTAHYVLGLGKKRLPEFMKRVWNNVDAFKTRHLDLQDCIDELEHYNIDFKEIIRFQNERKEEK